MGQIFSRGSRQLCLSKRCPRLLPAPQAGEICDRHQKSIVRESYRCMEMRIQGPKPDSVKIAFTIWLFNIAMENP